MTYPISYQHSEAAIDAVDILLDQCPPQEWLSKSISLRRLDVYSPVPADLVEKYDISSINVRLFIYVVRDKNPISVLKTPPKMLSESLSSVRWLQTDSRNRFLTCFRLTSQIRAWRTSSMV